MTMTRDLNELRNALRNAIEGGDRITGIRPLEAGHSNETYVLEGIGRILRMPPATASLVGDYDMARQHRIYAAVGRIEQAPPVPCVYELCEDETVIGAPFYVMELCRGDSTEWHPQEWLKFGGALTQHRVCAQWLSAVAAVHAMPAEIIGDKPSTPCDEAMHWLDLALRSDAPAQLRELLEDLGDNPAPASGSPTCVHGDAKFANFLWDRGKLVALLDWEMAHVGDPLGDLGYIISMLPADPGEAGHPFFAYLPGWWSRQEVVAAWEAATGRSAAGVARHEILNMAKIATLFARGVHLHRTGQSMDPRFGRWVRALPIFLEHIERRAAWHRANY